MNPNDLTVVIPTLNEEKNIGRLIDQIHELISGINILVVDDGSVDQTQALVRERSSKAILLDRSNAQVKGLSASIKEGIHNVSTPYFMVIDGDFQHPPDSLLEAVTCFKRDPDLVIAYRIKVENWPILRRLMSWGAQTLAYFALLIRRKQRPKDIMSGFFGGKTEEIGSLIDEGKISLKGYKILFDILKITPKNYKICQFGYVFKNREYGESKIGRTQIKEFVKSLF